MRILITADPMLTVPPKLYGGIERIIALLIAALMKRGHHVGLVGHPDSTIACDAMFTWTSTESGGLQIASHVRRLHSACRAFAPDVIHSFSRLALLVPAILAGHRGLMSFQREPTGRTVRWSARLCGRRLAFTGCSDYICQQGRPAGGVWFPVHNFLDRDQYRPNLQTSPDGPLVFLSRLDQVKGADLAIDMARAAEREIVVAGNIPRSGPDLEYFEVYVRPRLSLPGVHYVGEVNDAQKNDLLASASAMIAPIQWNEPFGIVFIESLACGTPVITCARGALPEIIEDGVHGYFVQGIEDGVSAINRMHLLDRKACRSRFEEAFCTDVIVPRYEAVYRNVLS